MTVAPLKMESSQATGRWRMSQSPCVAIWQSCSLAVAKHKYNNYIYIVSSLCKQVIT